MAKNKWKNLEWIVNNLLPANGSLHVHIRKDRMEIDGSAEELIKFRTRLEKYRADYDSGVLDQYIIHFDEFLISFVSKTSKV